MAIRLSTPTAMAEAKTIRMKVAPYCMTADVADPNVGSILLVPTSSTLAIFVLHVAARKPWLTTRICLVPFVYE
jgi:hypothetical protein